MNQIKKLVIASYTRNYLDEKKVAKITTYLSKSELREYIKALKAFERQSTVIVTLTDAKNKTVVRDSSNLFKDKKIVIRKDKSLIAGVRIEDFDDVYEFNLKEKINNIVSFINE